MTVAVAQRRLDDARIAIGPVMAVAGEQPHPLAVALNDQAIAVVLDFVDPFRPVRNFRRLGRNAGFERGFGHAGYLGAAHPRRHPLSRSARALDRLPDDALKIVKRGKGGQGRRLGRRLKPMFPPPAACYPLRTAIEYCNYRGSLPVEAAKIFLSYRREDEPGYALALFGRLEQSFPAERLFMDVEGGIKAGQDFVQVIEDRVNTCDVFLVLIGPKWLDLTDETGQRRLDNPHDFVHVEVELGFSAGQAGDPGASKQSGDAARRCVA